MENSFDKSMVLWLWQLVSNNQPQSILSNSLSFVGCYGNHSPKSEEFLKFSKKNKKGCALLDAP
jgi:hypothetical protein